MNYTPRKLIALYLLEESLPEDANTLWFCTSCYSCSIKCPRGIPLTEFIYELRRKFLDRYKNKHSNFYRILSRSIIEKKRLSEKMVGIYLMRINPPLNLKKLVISLKLLKKSRR